MNQTNKLFSIKPVLREWLLSSRPSCREEIVLCRLRIGHSYLTHSHLLKGEPVPQCVPCFTGLTVIHIFIEDFAPIRNKYFNVHNMHELFNFVRPDLIIKFLKDINILNKM